MNEILKQVQDDIESWSVKRKFDLFVKFYNFFTIFLQIDNINRIYYWQRNISEKANPERLGGAKLRDQCIREIVYNLLKVMVSIESAGLPITKVI